MNEQVKIAILWLSMIVCLAIHYHYPISDHFCGIANNMYSGNTPSLQTIPILMKLVVHLLPFIFLLLVLFIAAKTMRIINLCASIAYTLFHFAHFISQLSQEPMIWIQVMLLGIALGISVLLAYSSWNWTKETA